MWMKYVLIGLFALEIFVYIELIGKPRTIVTANGCIGLVLFNMLMIWGILVNWN